MGRDGLRHEPLIDHERVAARGLVESGDGSRALGGRGRVVGLADEAGEGGEAVRHAAGGGVELRLGQGGEGGEKGEIDRVYGSRFAWR